MSGRDLVPRDEDTLDLRHPDFEAVGVRWHRTGLEITSNLAYDDLESIAYVLSRTTDASRWGLCDALAHADRRWGEGSLGEGSYSQLAEVTGRSVGGLMNLASLARRVPPEVRRRELTLGHHEEVAGLKIPGTEQPDREAQVRWLQHAVDLRLTRDDLRNQIRAAQENLTRRVRSETKSQPVIEASPDAPRRSITEPRSLQAQIERPSLRDLAAEIVAMPRDDHGRISIGSDLLERLRAALEAS